MINRTNYTFNGFVLGAVASLALAGWSLPGQAQECTVSNWSGAVALTDDDAGTQGANNRRYGGPCGLRVPFDGTGAHLIDESPVGESRYIARFYGFFDAIGDDPVIVFAAQGGGEDQVQVWYNFPASNDLTLRAFDADEDPNDLTFPAVGTGWHSVELEWNRDTGEVQFLVNSDDPDEQAAVTINLSGLSIDTALLGNVGEADTGGSADFDDFDSRRSTRPGRLMAGDANDDGVINVQDALAVFSESAGTAFAPGQPDCNEDGQINVQDALCIFAISAGGQ